MFAKLESRSPARNHTARNKIINKNHALRGRSDPGSRRLLRPVRLPLQRKHLRGCDQGGVRVRSRRERCAGSKGRLPSLGRRASSDRQGRRAVSFHNH